MRKIFKRIPYWPLIILAFTLGIAPLIPEPHIWQKVKLLASNSLVSPVDMFDLLLHSTPWILLGLKISLARPDDLP